MQVTHQVKSPDSHIVSATRIVASTLGGIISIAGVMRGCFEILQGNHAPSGLVFNAIGPGQRIWEFATLHALTLVPNLLATGILAVLVGLLGAIWAVVFIDRKSSPWIMFVLSIILFLVGGGFGPPSMGQLPAWSQLG